MNGRIVSIDRPYIRPIVRGKETKTIEFVAKVNNIQIDGIYFIEHLSFKAFNEGICLKDSIHLQQELMKTKVEDVAADAIYANNANRKFCPKYGISTSFVRKGRTAKNEKFRKILGSELSQQRDIRLRLLKSESVSFIFYSREVLSISIFYSRPLPQQSM